jgi:hypothetical protein
MISGLELKLACSYDFSKLTSCCKKFVATYGRVFPLLVKFLKVGILFRGKQAPTGKFAVRGLTGVANWVFQDSLHHKCYELGFMKILKMKWIYRCQFELE